MKNAWSDNEIDILRKLYPDDDFQLMIKMLPGRSINAIKAKACELGILRRRNYLRKEKKYQATGIKKTPANDFNNMLESLYARIDEINVLDPEFAVLINKIDSIEIKFSKALMA